MEKLKSEEDKRQHRPAETGVTMKRYRRGEEPEEEEERVRTASDDEVEEFYAIIRRMRADGRKMRKGKPFHTTDEAKFQWRPRFRLEDFGREGGKDDENLAKSVSGDRNKRGRVYFDLNTEPEPDSEIAVEVSG